jgi:hypothetical protein
MPRPSRFTPGKNSRYPLYKKLRGPQCRSGRLCRISPPRRYEPRTAQPVVSRYAPTAAHRVTVPYVNHNIACTGVALTSTCVHTRNFGWKQFLGAFAKLRKPTISFVMSVRLSVRPHGTTRLPLYGVTRNLIRISGLFENLPRKFECH